MKQTITDFISSIDNKLYNKIRQSKSDAECRRYLKEHLQKQCDIHVVIKRIEEYAPKPVELPEFDYTQKADHIYCVEWGMKKAKRNEFEVYQKMLKELKEKYVL